MNSRPDIQTLVQKSLADLERLRDRVLPVKVGRAVVESTRNNFRRGGFYGSAWSPPLRTTVGFSGADGQYGPLLSRTNHLMSDTDYFPGPGKVTIANFTDYASVHNEGADITVTAKMKRFFWAKHYENACGDDSKAAVEPQASFWKNMALKKPGSRIRIPKRRFLGDSPQLQKQIENIIDTELKNYINGRNH